MKFIDEAIIEVKAGDGGNGIVSFRREKFIPRGGPDGGDGGNGGSCIFKAKGGLTTLMDLKYRKKFEATRGEHGKGKNMFGRKGIDVVIDIPIGSVVFDQATGKMLVDFTEEGQTFVIAKGGRGGHGNTHYTSSVRQAPKTAQKGQVGEEKKNSARIKIACRYRPCRFSQRRQVDTDFCYLQRQTKNR